MIITRGEWERLYWHQHRPQTNIRRYATRHFISYNIRRWVYIDGGRCSRPETNFRLTITAAHPQNFTKIGRGCGQSILYRRYASRFRARMHTHTWHILLQLSPDVSPSPLHKMVHLSAEQSSSFLYLMMRFEIHRYSLPYSSYTDSLTGFIYRSKYKYPLIHDGFNAIACTSN